MLHDAVMASFAPSRFHDAAETTPARIFAWGGRAIYVGPALNLSAHRNAVAVVALGLDHDFRVAEITAVTSGRYRRCRSVVIPPGALHHFADTQGRMAFLYIDPFSDTLIRLQASAREVLNHAAFHLNLEDALIATVTALADRAADWPTARRALDMLLAGPTRPAIDARVQAVLTILHSDTQERCSLAMLAADVGLSASRLRHMFKDATGVPFRRYRLWVAMRASLTCMARGETLTRAAMDGGFASSAHFSAAFRNMFGIEPSRLARGRMEMSS